MKISILTHSFIDPYNHSGRLFLGGSERYTRDLANLLIGNSYEVELHQPAKEDFQINYENIPIRGYSYEKGMGDAVTKMIKNTAKDNKIFISWFTSQLYVTDNFVCINHGIDWDFPEYKEKATIIRNVGANLKKANAIVSVDTNFLNWTRTIFGNETDRIRYIPNYADQSLFYPREKEAVSGVEGYDHNKITVVYPRRICRERGSSAMMEVAEKLLAKYENVQVVFVGEGHHKDEEYQRFTAWKKDKPIIYTHFSFDEMYKAYQMADIVVIPTQYAEGTSLSCLEAMAMEKAIVSTNIGGLCNLIIPDYNGKLVNRTVDDIYNAVCELIENESKRKMLAHNARSISDVLSKSIWEDRWLEVIKKAFKY